MFLLLSSCFWVGMAMLMARSFHELLPRVLATGVVGFATIVVSIELLSLVGAIRLAPVMWICGIVLVLGILSHKWPPANWHGPQKLTEGEGAADCVRPDYGLRLVSILLVGFATWAALDCLLYALFTPVLVDSDAPIYHLPFAIHWAGTGRLDFVATPFGEEGAPYFPANGDLWLTWLALTSDCAGVIKVGQWPFLLIGGLALYAAARQTGASLHNAAIPAGIWCCLPLTLRQSSVANVDLIWTAFFFIALLFVVRYRDAARRKVPARHELCVAALSLGIVLGTKSLGLVYAPLLIVPLIWLTWLNGGGLILIMGLLLPSSFWFARNVWMTGNPIYPLDVSWFGYRLLPGWYDSSAMRETAYHVPVYDWPLLEVRLAYAAGPFLLGVWFVCVISGVLRAVRSIRVQQSGADCLLSVLALVQVAIYWFVVPYNTQERFLLPALGIGLIPLSKSLSQRPWLVWPIGVVVLGQIWLALSGKATTMDDVSFRTLRALLAIGSGWRAGALLGCLVLAWSLVGERRWFGWIAACAAVLTGCSLYAAPLANFAARNPERAFFPVSGFGARMLPAWQIMARESSATGARIAYAGGNLPYYLLGPDCRNEAVYININRHRDWLPHDYHKALRQSGKPDTATIPWPQWYRESPDYNAWLENLRAAEIDLLFVSRTNLHGRRGVKQQELPHFPIEREWADAHPEDFDDLGPHAAPPGSIPWARVYRLRPRVADAGAIP